MFYFFHAGVLFSTDNAKFGLLFGVLLQAWIVRWCTKIDRFQISVLYICYLCILYHLDIGILFWRQPHYYVAHHASAASMLMMIMMTWVIRVAWVTWMTKAIRVLGLTSQSVSHPISTHRLWKWKCQQYGYYVLNIILLKIFHQRVYCSLMRCHAWNAILWGGCCGRLKGKKLPKKVSTKTPKKLSRWVPQLCIVVSTQEWSNWCFGWWRLGYLTRFSPINWEWNLTLPSCHLVAKEDGRK